VGIGGVIGGGGGAVGGGAVVVAVEGVVSVGIARGAPQDAQNALSIVLGAPHCGQYIVLIDLPSPNQFVLNNY
jgi:hypothetical protein